MVLSTNRCLSTHLVASCVAAALAPLVSAQTFVGSADLDQIRNGSASNPNSPANWVNGNAGQSNAHYVEGYSVAYRCVITGASLNQHTLDIEWDITHSNKHALDYITNFNRIQPHGVFTHAGGCGPGCPEVIDPTIGVGGPLAGPTTFPIPAPSSAGSPMPGQPTASFNSLSALDRSVSIWNGTITNIQYLSQGNLAGGNSASSARITFTANASTVIIAWGGHIARATDWGAGNSAAQISGSPYHTRLVGLDGSGGNQDRSLSANAVIFPPDCEIGGPTVVCPGSTNAFCASGGQGQTYQWSVQSNCGASIVGSSTGECVQVQSCSTCNTSFTLNLTVTNQGGDTQCSAIIDVEDHDDPIFINCPQGQSVECNSELPPCADVTATDNCDGIIQADCDDGPFVPDPDGCGGTITRTFTATDSCGNTATCEQVFTIVDTTRPNFTAPPDQSVECVSSIPACPVLTATDTCAGTIAVSCTTGSLVGGPCGGTVTRTFTATDPCGNTRTRLQVFTVDDNTPPVIFHCPDDASVACGEPMPPCLTNLDASDNCTVLEDLVVTCQDIPSGGEGAPTGCAGGLTRVYTVTDQCGNSAQCEQSIAVEPDNIDPIFVLPIPPLDVCLGMPAFIPTPDVSDNCDPTPTVTCTRSDGLPCTDPYFPQGLTNVTFTVTDACGNSASVVIPVNPGCCDVEFETFNQSYWGGNSALSRIQALLGAPHGDLLVGKAGSTQPRSAKCKKPAAQAIITRLPAGGTAKKFPTDLGNAIISATTLNTSPALPLRADGTFKNVLLGQTIALALNVRNDKQFENGTLGFVALSHEMTTTKPDGSNSITWQIPQAVMDAMLNNNLSVTVNDLLELANRALAGRSTAPATLEQVNTAVSRINAMFVGGRLLLDCNCAPLSAPAHAPPAHDQVGDLSGDGVVDKADLMNLLSDWGHADSSADLNNDGLVNTRDLIELLANWGAQTP